MLKLPTVILEHTTRSGRHYDWLLADPRSPQGPLWTARTMVCVHHWMTVKRWALEPIQPHRRLYLKFQGPISGGRGHVIRLDRGWYVPRLWSDRRIVMDLHLKHCQGQVCIEQRGSMGWMARLMPSDSGDADYLAPTAGINLV